MYEKDGKIPLLGKEGRCEKCRYATGGGGMKAERGVVGESKYCLNALGRSHFCSVAERKLFISAPTPTLTFKKFRLRLHFVRYLLIQLLTETFETIS
jgi:hypothetical protein